MSLNDILKTTWRCDDNFCTFSEIKLLLLDSSLDTQSVAYSIHKLCEVTYTTNDGHASESERRRKFSCFAFYLLSEFTGRSEDKRVRPQMPIVVGKRGQARNERQHGDHECRRFTGPGFCDANDITVLQADRNGLSLNR